MNSLSVRPTDEDLETLVQTYADSLYRLCFSILGNRADAEDAVSDVIVRYMTKAPVFTDENHRKAWLLRSFRFRIADRNPAAKGTRLLLLSVRKAKRSALW